MNNTKNLPANKIRPLIKWTGGKYNEFAEFEHLIPSFKNYYEPFFGGGGVFFSLQPQNLSYLNDKSKDLFSFYQLIKSGDRLFKNQLITYADAWEQATILSKNISANLLSTFIKFVDHSIDKEQLSVVITKEIDSIHDNSFQPLFDDEFIIDRLAFKKSLIHSLNDKFKRIKHIQHKESKIFLSNELLQHVETGVKSGLYLYLRKLSNDVAKNRIVIENEKSVANWYFVREFCYASMFRYNRNGEFNIPYGGIAYNSKNLRQKVDAIFSSQVKDLFKNSKFYNFDFEEFLKENPPQKDDFVFIDPPYDSEFSEYDQNSFSKDDQARLRDAILHCRGKCMVVIKETPFICEIYNRAPFTIVNFEKTYTYNVRGRNNRGTRHLIILNY